MNTEYILYYPEFFHLSPIGYTPQLVDHMGNRFNEPKKHLNNFKILSLCWHRIYMQPEHLTSFGCTLRKQLLLPLFSKQYNGRYYSEIENLVQAGIFCFTHWDKYDADEFIRLKGEEQYQQTDNKKDEILHRKSIESLFLNKNVSRIKRAGITQNTIIKDFIQNIGDLGFPRAKEAQEAVKRSEYKGLSRGKIEGYPYSSEQHLIELKKLSKPEQLIDYVRMGTVAYTQYAVETHLSNLHSYLPEYLYNYHPIPKTGKSEELLKKRISFLYSPEFTEYFFETALKITNIKAIKYKCSKIICNLRDSKHFYDFVHIYQLLLQELQSRYDLHLYGNIKKDDKEEQLNWARITSTSNIDSMLDGLKIEYKAQTENYRKYLVELKLKIKTPKERKPCFIEGAESLQVDISKPKIYTSDSKKAEKLKKSLRTVAEAGKNFPKNFDIVIIDQGDYHLDEIGIVYFLGREITRLKSKKEEHLTPLHYRILVHMLKNKYRSGNYINIIKKCWFLPKDRVAQLKNDWPTMDAIEKTETTRKHRKEITKLSSFLTRRLGLSLFFSGGKLQTTKTPSYCVIEMK
ncbi:hypothetical protein KAR91_27200 [Candidatus Pacearchaeota archaeon]|nr:hypothetical protein [Candidatus Pacearchaeota archaeon]